MRPAAHIGVVGSVEAQEERSPMTKREAELRLGQASEDEAFELDEAHALFRAIYGRPADADDGDVGQIISLCYAAIED